MEKVVHFFTPFGGCGVIFDDVGVKRLFFTKSRMKEGNWEYKEKIILYLQGKIKNLLDIPLNMSGISSFAAFVYGIVREIPYGRTLSYKDVANLSGTSPRSVGRILSKNPLPLLIPCHRVIAKDGIGGFFDIELKKKLLLLEGAL